MTEVLNETDYQIDCEEFVRLADFVLSAMHVSTEVELNIIFIDPEPMEELHVRWLDLEGPTDVMSFPMDELRPGTADHPTESGTLGDICICPQSSRLARPDIPRLKKCSSWRLTACFTFWAMTMQNRLKKKKCSPCNASSS